MDVEEGPWCGGGGGNDGGGGVGVYGVEEGVPVGRERKPGVRGRTPRGSIEHRFNERESQWVNILDPNFHNKPMA